MSFNGIKPIGDWKAQIQTPLHNALRASVDICGRTGAEACKHAIILMAASAAAMTKQAPKNRKVEQDPRLRGKGGQFVRVFKKKGGESKLYRFSLEDNAAWIKARNIAHRGLAKKSWMWGLQKFGLSSSRPISGVGRLITIATEKTAGFILTNALSYLLKILPPGWAQIVEQKAANKIMKQATMKIERSWLAEMRKSRRTGMAIGGGLQKYFLKAG